MFNDRVGAANVWLCNSKFLLNGTIMRRFIGFITLLLVVCCMLCMQSCHRQSSYTKESERQIISRDLSDIKESGVLRVITMEGAFSYYVAGETDEMGYDYDMAMNLADYLDVEVQLIVADNMADMVEKLRQGEGDLIAYRLPKTQGLKQEFCFVDKSFPSVPVLVQRKGRNQVSDVTELCGKQVYVSARSNYLKRLHNLNDELGGGIEVIETPDSTTIDHLIIAVSQGEIEMTVADNDLVELSAPYLGNIDYSVAVGLGTSKSWLVRADSPELLTAVNEWLQSIENSRFISSLSKRYVEKNSYFKNFELNLPKGYISPYDDIFQVHAPKINWDWRLLAALAWNESHFNPEAVSRMGAMGIMQMMPRTAAKFGLDEQTVLMPEYAIAAGVEYIKRLDMIFRVVENVSERQKFILAGYNAGPGHVLDAMALAEKYGENPQVWYGNVEKYLLLKQQPEYYKDSVTRCGFFRGGHTVRYVQDVMRTYEKYMGH